MTINEIVIKKLENIIESIDKDINYNYLFVSYAQQTRYLSQRKEEKKYYQDILKKYYDNKV